ncbi:MAG: tRNA pseudouridine(13) synthase TruD [Nanoarchaeota archaeon]|nr:tRNA pseudouridine(13) synthase TruD [Nanoarchaeota archaeon]
MYLIKAKPEDFMVVEQSDLKLQDSGIYRYYGLDKRDLSTMEAVAAIAEKLNISTKFINIGGNKDKTALTRQTISIKGGPKHGMSIGKLSLTYLGAGDERMALGMLTGNRFEITVRRLQSGAEERRTIPNYFDDQRFGITKNNHLIGKHIIRREFEGACRLIGLATEDPIAKLASIEPRMLRLYVHAYQSYLFNKLLCMRIEKSGDHDLIDYALGKLLFPRKDVVSDEELSLPGFGTEGADDILKEEGLTSRDFIIRQLPGLSAEGVMRKAFVGIQELKLSELEDDEMHPGFKKQTVKFSLPKGSYATIVIKSLFR